MVAEATALTDYRYKFDRPFRGGDGQAYIIIYYSWNGGRAEAVCAGEKE